MSIFISSNSFALVLSKRLVGWYKLRNRQHLKPNVREILPTKSHWEFRQKPPPEALCVVLKQNQRSQWQTTYLIQIGLSQKLINLYPYAHFWNIFFIFWEFKLLQQYFYSSHGTNERFRLKIIEAIKDLSLILKIELNSAKTFDN